FSPFLWVSIFAAGGPLCVVAPWPTCVGGACLWLCFGRTVSVKVTVLALAAATLGIWRANYTIAKFGSARVNIEQVLRPPTRCVVTARILESPTVNEN